MTSSREDSRKDVSSLERELARLRLECALGITVLDALDIGAFAVDKRGRLVHGSCEPEEASHWGFRLGACKQLQIAGSAPATARLNRLILESIEHTTQQAMLIRSHTGGKAGIHAVIAPLNTAQSMANDAERMALVIASNLDRRSNDLARQVTALFQFSPAEAKLALALANGRTPGEFASESKLSIATVRSQLRSVFAKTGSGRQVDLVRVLASIPILRPRKLAKCTIPIEN